MSTCPTGPGLHQCSSLPFPPCPAGALCSWLQEMMQVMHWPPPPSCSSHRAPRAPHGGGHVLSGMAAAPVPFPQHTQHWWDTRLWLPQLTPSPLALLSPEATLCYHTNHLLWGTRPGRFPWWDSRNNVQRQWGKHTGWDSNGGTRK